MAENFERHKSTRWVRNSVPSYDAWGDNYAEYDYAPAIAETAEPEPENPADLVLLIDKLRADNSDDDMDSNDESVQGDNHSLAYAYPRYQPRTEAPHTERTKPTEHTKSTEHTKPTGYTKSTEHAEAGGATVARDATEGSAGIGASEPTEPRIKKGEGELEPQTARLPHIDVGLANQLAPPTPTFSQFSGLPETSQSERSFASDADSIQREPDHLNVVSLAEIQEERGRDEDAKKTANDAEKNQENGPVTQEQTQERQYPNQEQQYPNQEQQPEEKAPLLSLVLSTDRMNLDSSDDSDQFSFGEDDWGYNSQHSSNDEDEEQPEDQMEHAEMGPEAVETVQTVPQTVPQTNPPTVAAPAKHHIQTDALDSLISDLLKMERHLFDETSAAAAESSVGELPSLASIHEFSLPDFHDQSFNDSYSRDHNVLPEGMSLSASLASADFRVQHERFMTNVLSRTASIRKPPLFHLSAAPASDVDVDLDNQELDRGNIGDIGDIGAAEATGDTDGLGLADNHSDSSLSTDNEQLVPVASTGSLSTGKMSFDNASVVAEDEVSRRASTMSQQTLAFGNWKPNTGMYRDKFVTDNDTESQMNMSIFNNDANYSKFTGLRNDADTDADGHSILSVPETVDAYMPSIMETASDEDEPVKSSLTTSVLKEHAYDPRFEEAETSLEQLPEDTTMESKELDRANTSVGSATTNQTGTEKEPSSKPLLQPYPVFNWKKIVSISQPVDRIGAFRAAKIAEADYDTGLNYWLTETLKLSEVSSNIQIGKIASQAYQNAQHNDIRRHTSIRSRVSLVKDKMETGGLQASSLGRKFLSRGKKLMKSGD